MVQVLLKRIGDIKEWILLELQGELVSRYDNGFAGNVLGDLHFSKTGEPILIIGHHILHGKVADLEKPYGVIVPSVDSIDCEEGINQSDCSKRYQIKAIVKRKVVFKNRPKPIITHVPKHI